LRTQSTLQTVRTPTLVLGRRGDEVAPVEAAAALAAAIPDTEFRELPPGPHGLFDDAMASAILDFVCGASPETSERVLSTVMFTDIVSSTELLSAQGDAHWRHELDAYDRLVDRLLSKYGGQRAKHTGDGVFASRTVRDLSAGSGLRFESLGAQRSRGWPRKPKSTGSVNLWAYRCDVAVIPRPPTPFGPRWRTHPRAVAASNRGRSLRLDGPARC
jgi:hypothetical protein